MANYKRLNFLLLLAILGTSFLLQCDARAAPSPDEDEEDDFFKDSEEDKDKSDEGFGQRSLAGVGGQTHNQDGHEGHVMAPAPVSNSGSDSSGKFGFSGGSVSNFDESCESKNCNTDRNLRCDSSTRKCICNEGHIYIREQEKCYPAMTAKTDHPCEFHEQCEKGPTGALSRCDKVKGTCECFDTEKWGSRPVAMYNGVCFLRKVINETCSLDAQCQTTMQVNSYCTPDMPRRCACQRGYIWDDNIEECLKIADKGLSSDCKADVQCTTSPMGELSRCVNKKCECHNPVNPGQDNIAFYDKTGTCFKRMYWNATCTLDDECKASVSANAECLPQKQEDGFIGGNMLLICQCPEGKKCAPLGEGGGVEALRSFNAVIVLGIVMVFRGFRI